MRTFGGSLVSGSGPGSGPEDRPAAGHNFRQPKASPLVIKLVTAVAAQSRPQGHHPISVRWTSLSLSTPNITDIAACSSGHMRTQLSCNFAPDACLSYCVPTAQFMQKPSFYESFRLSHWLLVQPAVILPSTSHVVSLSLSLSLKTCNFITGMQKRRTGHVCTEMQILLPQYVCAHGNHFHPFLSHISLHCSRPKQLKS